MRYDFDQIIERSNTDSIKWGLFPHGVIPLWVADMDFRSADPIIEALQERAAHGVFGYSRASQELIRAVQDRLQRLYQWKISERNVIFVPGIVTGLNIAFQAFAAPGEGIIAQPPVYFHFLRDPEQHGRVLQQVPLARSGNRYEIDFDLLERSITKETRLFALCNPHNPVGRVFARDELEKIAEVCLRKRLIICSDEIHCDLIYPPHKHIPIASLSPEVEERTVTLMAPSKTYNIAGLDCGYAIIKSKELRNKWMDFSSGLIPHINIMGHVAALAALLHGQDWLGQVLKYLEGNRDFIEAYLREEIPNITMNKVEGTYLGWLNCEKAGMIRNSAEVMSNPAEFFRAKAGVALSDGIEFGKDGENFVRLNFACSRKTLATALNRMRAALEIL